MGERVAADPAAQRLDRADASQGSRCCFGVGGRSSAADKQRHDGSFFLFLVFLFFFSLAVYSSPSLIPCVVHHRRDDMGSAAAWFRRLILLYFYCGVVVVSPRRRCLRGFRPRRRGAKHASWRGGCRLAAMCVVVAVVSNILVHNNGAAFGFR